MRQYSNLHAARLPVRQCARAAAVPRSSTVRAVAVAQPHRQTFSYAELIQSYQRAEADIAAANSSNTARDTGYNSSSRKDQPMYISDPAVYTNPKLMAKQIQNSFGQVLSAGKAAIGEVRIAIDPQQRPHAVVVGDRVVVREATVQPKPHPEPLKAVAEQAVRLTQAVAEDVHNATQDAYHRYGPHVTAAGVRLVGKGTAALGVEIIGKRNTARAIGLLGSTNAAVATEELGVSGVLKVTRRLGPWGLWKILVALGPRGIMNMGSHIMLRMSHGVREKSASLNPDHHHQQQQQRQQDEVDRVAAELKAWGVDSSTVDELGNRRERSTRSPAVALLAALAQWLLMVVAGMLQWMSNVAQRGVHTWDRWHPDDSPRDSSSRRAADSRKGSAVQAELDKIQQEMQQQERQRAQRAREADARAAAAVADVVDQVQAAAPQQGGTRWDVQGA